MLCTRFNKIRQATRIFGSHNFTSMIPVNKHFSHANNEKQSKLIPRHVWLTSRVDSISTVTGGTNYLHIVFFFNCCFGCSIEDERIALITVLMEWVPRFAYRNHLSKSSYPKLTNSVMTMVNPFLEAVICPVSLKFYF